jgi:dihydrofolate synthase / folylpolyglutamate synthase
VGQRLLSNTLSDWLVHLERLHPSAISLGLERVRDIKARLELDPEFAIVTVGGTNGKGSTCAMLEAILAAAGYRVGLYSSPHLLRYNERVRIGRESASDQDLCAAFAAVEAVRGDTPLTYFEFGTLAAVWLFCAKRIEVAVLEVGLGGRLDAVNAFDPDCAVVTSVALDHVDYLGSTVEAIGYEKAGIYRAGKPAVFSDQTPPLSLTEHAARIGADLLLLQRDFGFVRQDTQWQFWGRHGKHYGLPYPVLRGAYQLHNACAALAALDELRAMLPVALQYIKRGLAEVDLPGRFQVLPGQPAVVLDVAHNPHAVGMLAANLAVMRSRGKTYAVFGMLKDKDIRGAIEAIAHCIDHWFVAPIATPRGAATALLMQILTQLGLEARASAFDSLGAAYAAACHAAAQDDRIIAFGSFYTVAEILQAGVAHRN